MSDASRDANRVTTLLGVNDVTGLPQPINVNSSGEILVSMTGGGSGDVVGPASATDNAIARFDTTTGQLIQNSAVTIADTTGAIAGTQSVTIGVTGTATGTLLLKGTTSGTVTVKTADAAGTWSLTLPADDGTASQFLQTDGAGVTSWATGNAGTVTAVSVASANGLAGTSSGGATPALTLSTSITGILEGNGTAISAASVTGSGSVVLATSPALATPSIGVATGTSLSVSGLLASATGLTLEETGVGTDVITLQAPASIAAPYTLTLPVDDGAVGEFLKTDGSGVLSWATPGGSGNVNAALGLTDNAIVRGDGGTTGVQTSAILIDDSNNVTGIASLTLTNTGLHLLDTNASHDLIIVPGSDLTVDRNFTITTGDAARTLSMTGNITISGDLITVGDDSLTFTTAGATNVTLPTTGTLVNSAVTTLSSLVSIGTITTGVWNATDVPVSAGGTGLSTISALSVWVANSANVVTEVTPGAGNSVRVNGAGTAWEAFTPSAAVPTLITVAGEVTDISCFPLFVTAATGDLGPKTNAGLAFNSSTGLLTATGFSGPLTGNVTGNASGTAATVTGAAQAAITSLGTLTTLTVDDITINGNTISSAGASTLAITPTAGQAITFDGTVTLDAGVIAGATSITSTTFVGNLTGNASGTAATVTGAAQAAITSVGTLTTLTVDDVTINGNTISSAGASTLAITPTAGQAITFDGTVTLDAGVIAGATSITSTTFIGALTGTASGNLVSGGALGTPSSGTLTNATGLPAAAVVPGTLATGTYLLSENASIGLDPAGSADGKFSGITVTATAGYAQAFGDLVYLDPTDSRWEAVDANAASGADGDPRGIIGMVVVAGTDGAACTILLQGIIRADAKFPALTINGPCYASETAGAIVQTAPSTSGAVVRIVGVAITADELYFNPQSNFIVIT